MNAAVVRSPLNLPTLLIGIVAVLVAAPGMMEFRLPLISDVRTGLLVLVLLGLAVCSLSGIGRATLDNGPIRLPSWATSWEWRFWSLRARPGSDSDCPSCTRRCRRSSSLLSWPDRRWFSRWCMLLSRLSRLQSNAEYVAAHVSVKAPGA
jgi:hypothetical protein